VNATIGQAKPVRTRWNKIADRCFCPIGWALAGSKPLPAGRSTAPNASISKRRVPMTCAACAVGTYAVSSTPVPISRCRQCPPDTNTLGAKGSRTCYVSPGRYFDETTFAVKDCPPGYQCPGGDVFGSGSLENIEDVDECLGTPCANGGTCTNLPGGFSCQCPPEWAGPTCTDVVIIVPGELNVAYYRLGRTSTMPDFSTLQSYLETTVPEINFASVPGNFANSGEGDFVGALFTGWVDIPTAGTWTFFTNSDDGSKLFIDNQLIVDNDGLHGMRERSGTIAIAAPGRHLIRVEFFEDEENAGLIVLWQGSGVTKQIVPSARYSRTSTT
jgi:hypothetical protein